MMKTEPLPGMSDVILISPQLSEALDDLRTVRAQRMALTKQEVEIQDRVLKLMHDLGYKFYLDDGYDPPLSANIVEGKEKVKIKMGKSEDDEQ